MSRLWWKERVGGSRFLRAAYADAEGLASHGFGLLGHPFEATRRLLHAWKHLGEEGLGAGRAARVFRLIDDATRKDGALLPVADNRLRADFVRSRRARALRRMYGAFPLEHRVRLRFPRDDPDPERQGDLIVLKSPDDATGEKGVLLVMYHEGIEALAAVYDLPALAKRWMLVLETSNWGAQDGRFLPYLGRDVDAVVMAPRAPDALWFERLQSNLVPVRVGSGEWVDPTTFTPRAPGDPYVYDVLMVASWDPLKRHEVLLRALADLRARGRPLKVGLVGVPSRWKMADVSALVDRHGVRDQVTFHERIPHAEVARLVARSRVSVLLSRQEGSNRAVYESLFTGTPVVVYAQHKGINLEHVNARTGVLAEDDRLADALLDVIDHPDRFDPRGFALETLGYPNAARGISKALQDLAHRTGRPWTRDIVAKRNAPNLRYAEPGLYPRFAADYESLAPLLLPVD